MTFNYRPGQEAAIEAIVRHLKAGTSTVLLDAGVGSGKSLILAHVSARLYDEKGWNGYYTTPQVSLAKQLENDRLLTSYLQVVTGRRNYPCPALDDSSPLSVFHRSPAEGDTLEMWVRNPGREERVLTWRQTRERYRRQFGLPHAESAEDGACVTGWACSVCQGAGRQGADRCPACKGSGLVSEGAIPCVLRATHHCEYFSRKDAAMAGPLATMTLAYLLAVTAKSPEDEDEGSSHQFGPRDLLILDEAHGLPKAAQREMGLNLSADTVHRGGGALRLGEEWRSFWWEETRDPLQRGELERWDGDRLKEWLAKVRSVVSSEAAKAFDAATEDRADSVLRKRARSLVRLHGRVNEAVEDLDARQRWALEVKFDQYSEPYVRITPVFARRFLAQRLWRLGRFRVLSSGTFGDIGEFLDSVGLNPSEVAIVRMDSTFPPQNGKVVLMNTAPLSRQTETESLPLIVEALRDILTRERKRGLIHVPSYRLARILTAELSEFAHRFVQHDSEDRNETLEQWMKDGREDTVMVGVQMNEGLDLIDDLAVWQVIVKAPFPDLSDVAVRTRFEMEGGQRWYRAETQRAMLQALGRIVRSATDRGVTYVLDTHACRLLSDPSLPEWAKARIRAGDDERRMKLARPWAVGR